MSWSVRLVMSKARFALMVSSVTRLLVEWSNRRRAAMRAFYLSVFYVGHMEYETPTPSWTGGAVAAGRY
jgi:hypothetical protein